MSKLGDSAYGGARKLRLLFSAEKLPTFVLGMVETTIERELVLDSPKTMIGMPLKFQVKILKIMCSIKSNISGLLRAMNDSDDSLRSLHLNLKL